MGWAFRHFDPEVRGRLDEHGGDKEIRDERLWEAFEAEATEAVMRIARDARYSELEILVDWEPVNDRG